MQKMTLKTAKAIAGNVQKGNSKIMGSTWSLPPTSCKTGSKLVDVIGSTCNKCYDFQSWKMYPSVRLGRERNLALWESAEQSSDIDALYFFASALAKQIQAISDNKTKKGLYGAGYHRWFTGGDIQSTTMLRIFIEVARMLPDIQFWLPTREAGIVKRYNSLNLVPLPDNLTIRLSAPMVDGAPVKGHRTTSTVHRPTSKPYGQVCKAYENKGNCGPCSDCWNSDISNISYKLH